MRPAHSLSLLIAAPFLLAAANPTRVIDQKDGQFSAKAIQLAVGDSVVFVNKDKVFHNVFSSSSGLEFKVKRMAPGRSEGVQFNAKGTATVRCAFHPKMKLTVTVR